MFRRALLPACAALATLASITASSATAAPTPGFRETWNSGTTQGWGGSATIVYSNPGSGGLANSGYLRLEAAPPDQHFGTRSTGAEYLGSWTAAGITQVRVWLSDLATDDTLEVHFSFGKFTSVFQYDIGFVPPVNGWGEYVVDLTNPASFTRTIAQGTGTYAGAMDSVEVVHLRHDLAPFIQFPNPASGDLGVDGLLLTNGTLGVPPSQAPALRPVSLAAPAPNPARGPVTLAVTSADDAEVTIRIVDAAGRRIREHRLAGVAGTRTWVWDRTDDAGRRVAAGAYRVIAASRSGGMGRPLVIVD